MDAATRATHKWSPAAAFLLAADNACSTRNKGNYTAMMHAALKLAIDHRMDFLDHSMNAREAKQMAIDLRSVLDFHSSSGVFRTFESSYYSRAVWAESSYARLYQVAENLSPWKCAEVYADKRWGTIATGPGHDLCRYNQGLFAGQQSFYVRRQTKGCKPKVAVGLYIELPGELTLFRCTAITSESIRFVPRFPDQSERKRLIFTRDQWNELQARE